MKKSWFPILGLLLLTAILPGCAKREGLKTQSTYAFTNQSGRQVTFDVYRTEEDYTEQQNRLHQYIIEPNASQPVVMDVGSICWIDWYSSDYSYNNWQSERSSYNRSSPPPALNIAAEDQQMILKPAIQDTARSVLINGGGLSSRWRCTISNANPQINGTHEFLFKKDFTCTYTYTNPSGGSAQTATEYFLSQVTGSVGLPQGFTAFITTLNQTNTFRLTCNTGYLISPHTGRDTMRLLFQQITSQDYPLVRQ